MLSKKNLEVWKAIFSTTGQVGIGDPDLALLATAGFFPRSADYTGLSQFLKVSSGLPLHIEIASDFAASK